MQKIYQFMPIQKLAHRSFKGTALLLTAALQLSFSSFQSVNAQGLVDNTKEVQTSCFVRVGKFATTFALFTSDMQELKGSNEELLTGWSGTVLGTRDRQHQLHMGKLIVTSGKKPITIATAHGEATISQDTTALLNAPSSGPLQIELIKGSAQSEISFVPFGSKAPLKLKVGELLSSKRNGVASELLADEDNKVREELARLKEILADAKQSAESIESAKLHARAVLLHAQKSLFATEIRIQKAGAANHSNAMNSDQHASGVIFAYASAGTEFSQCKPGEIVLKKGALFLNSESDCSITTDVGSVHANKDSLWSVEYDSANLRVKQCSGMNGVSVQIGKSTLPLYAGREILVTNNKISTTQAAQAAPADGVGRRKLCILPVENKTAVVGDFSLPSLLSNCEYMRYLRQDSGRHSQRAMEKILKASVAINIAQANRGKYFTLDSSNSNVPDGLFWDAN